MAEEKKLAAPYGDYAVTSDGKVWSYKGAEGKRTEVAQRKDANGYARVNLSNSEEANGFKDFRVHELMAKAFLGANSDGGEILHKDGDKNNNSAANLQYGSKSENAKQREEHKRQDNMFRVDSETFKVGEWEVTPEGYLQATAVVARVGPMEYLGPDGPYIEYVTEEALKDDVSTLEDKPLTFEHPPEGQVNADNYRIYTVGIVKAARYDEALKAQVARVIVQDADTIRKVLQDNIREVSPGYHADIIEASRTDDPYPIKQVRRMNNHVAITKAGRGGPESAIRLDSKGHVILTREDSMEKEELQAKLDAMEAEKADMAKKLDAMQAKVDAFEKMASEKDEEKEDEDAQRNDSALFVRLFNERNDALDVASRVGVEVVKEWTNDQLKAAIVAARLGDDAVRNDSIEALNGMYEAVVKMTPAKNSPEHLASAFVRNDSQYGESKGQDEDIFAFYNERRADAAFFKHTKE